MLQLIEHVVLTKNERTYYLRLAQQHGLTLGYYDIKLSPFGEWTVDGSDPELWIEVVCGCYEDGGRAELHVGA